MPQIADDNRATNSQWKIVPQIADNNRATNNQELHRATNSQKMPSTTGVCSMWDSVLFSPWHLGVNTI